MIRVALLTLSLFALASCGGSGDGKKGLGGSSDAYYMYVYLNSITTSGNLSCFGDRAATLNAVKCASIGGAYSLVTIPASGTCNIATTAGNCTANNGTASNICTVSGNIYEQVGALNTTACTQVGGAVSVRCQINNSSDCSNAGGIWNATASYQEDSCAGYTLDSQFKCEEANGSWGVHKQISNNAETSWLTPASGRVQLAIFDYVNSGYSPDTSSVLLKLSGSMFLQEAQSGVDSWVNTFNASIESDFVENNGSIYDGTLRVHYYLPYTVTEFSPGSSELGRLNLTLDYK